MNGVELNLSLSKLLTSQLNRLVDCVNHFKLAYFANFDRNKLS